MTTTTAPASIPEPATAPLPPTPSRRPHTLAVWLLIALGIALRLARYLHDHSMWLDESQLSLNFINQPWHHLLEPLFFNQAAPLGFLFIEKGVITLFGASELSLRLQPLLCGIASVPVAYFLFRRTLGPRGQLFALTLFSFAEEALNYVSQVKQYSNDLLLTTLLLWLAVRFFQERRGLLPLALAGAIGIWFSHAAVFIVAAIGFLLAWEALRPLLFSGSQKEPTSAARLPLFPVALVGILWIASFGAEYVLSLQSISHSSYLLDFWEDAFPPAPISYNSLLWYFTTLQRLPLDTLSFAGLPQTLLLPFKIVAVIAAWLIIDGFFVLRQNSGRRAVASLIGLVFACLFLAGALQRYPLQGRLLLFTMPLWILLAAASAENYFAMRSSLFSWTGRASAALVVASTVVALFFTITHPFDEPDNRKMVQYLADHAKPGDTLYALGPSFPPVQFYLLTRYHKLANDCFLYAGDGMPWLSSYKDDDVNVYLSRRHPGRVWVLFSQLTHDTPALFVQRDHTVEGFSRITPRLDHFATPETQADLFDIP